MKDPMRRAGWVLLGLLMAPVAAADASQISTTVALERAATDQDMAAVLEPEGDQILLELEDAIVMALRHNLALVVERYRRSQSILGIQEALGAFDLNLESQIGFTEDARPTTSLLEDADIVTTEVTFFNTNLSQLTAYGGTAQIDYDNNKFDSSDQRVQPNPQFNIDLDFTYTQPLLRNFGRVTTEQEVIIARNASAISRQDFRSEVESVVQQVSDRYWELVEAREQLAVSEESLDLATNLHEMNRVQVEVGTMAPLEMVQSEAGVATREEEIIRRRAAVEDRADDLRRLLNLARGVLWSLEITPVTDPITPYETIDLETAVATALAERYDVRSLRLDNETLDIRARVARNQTKPRLDLQAAYRLNSVSGDLNFIDPVTGEPVSALGGYDDALEQILDREFDGWQLAATFAYPLQNRTARARRAQAELAVEQGTYALRDLELAILTEVRQAARAVRTAQQQIESAKVSSKLGRKNLEAEQKRYENGLSTSFEVLQIQEDLSEARSREVSAIIGYRRALVDFYRATGQLLERMAIELATEGE